MGAQEIANFILKLDDQLTSGAVSAASALVNLGARAATAAKQLQHDLPAAASKAADSLGKTAKSLNQNQLISQFETLSSLLIQVGGDVSQFGILASSAARPIALLHATLGGAGIAMLAIPAAAAGAIFAINSIAAAGEGAIETLQKMKRIDLIDHDALVQLKDYRTTVDDLSASYEALKTKAGAAAAPGASRTASATSLLMQGDSQAWRAVGEMFTSPLGVVSGFEKLQKIADSRTQEAIAEEKARRDWEVETTNQMNMAATEEDRREKAEKAAPAAISAADAERARLAREGEQAAKEAARAIEATRDAFIKANEAILKPYREREADLDRIAQDEAKDTLRADQKRYDEETEQIMNEAKRTLAESQKRDEEAAAQALEEERQLAAFEANAKAQRIQGANTLASAFTGGDVGSMASAMGGGPWGMVLSAISSGAAYDSLENLFDQVLEIYTDLPEQIGRIAGELVPSLIRAAPEMASAFVVLGPAIVKELVIAAPEILKAVVDAIVDLPSAMVEALADLFTVEIGGKEVGLGNIDKDSRGARAIGGAVIGGFFGGPLGAAAGAGVGALTGRGKGGGIQIGQIVAPNPRDLIRQLRQIQGSYGFGEDLGVAF